MQRTAFVSTAIPVFTLTDVLMVLEAMKMENEIMAPCDGTVTAVSVNPGMAVETNAVLCTLA